MAALAAGIEHAQLPFELLYRAVDQRFAEFDAGIVEQIARRKIVGAVDHDIHVLQQGFDIAGSHACLQRFDLHAWIERGNALRGRADLGDADAVFHMQDLALQIAAVHHIVIGDPQVADPGGSEIERRRRAKSACTDQQHARTRQALLAFEPDLRQAQMARIALEKILFVGRQGRAHQGKAGAGPCGGATEYRRHLRIALRAQDLRRLCRALAALADQHDLARLLRQMLCGCGFQIVLRNRQCAFGLAAGTFVQLPDIDQQGALQSAQAGICREM